MSVNDKYSMTGNDDNFTARKLAALTEDAEITEARFNDLEYDIDDMDDSVSMMMDTVKEISEEQDRARKAIGLIFGIQIILSLVWFLRDIRMVFKDHKLTGKRE